MELGNLVQARLDLEEALTLATAMGDRFLAAGVLLNLSITAFRQGYAVLSAKLLSASEMLRHAMGAKTVGTTEEYYQEHLSKLKARLSEEAFQHAWAEGETLTLDEIMVELERHPSPAPETPAATANPVGLTPREREVLSVLAKGLSDKKIADVLGLSPSTVSRHVANILGKTGLKNRTALTVCALERGLGKP